MGIAAGAARISTTLLTVFVILTLTFFALAIGAYTLNANMSTFGGYLGIATALAAWCAAARSVLASIPAK